MIIKFYLSTVKFSAKDPPRLCPEVIVVQSSLYLVRILSNKDLALLSLVVG